MEETLSLAGRDVRDLEPEELNEAWDVAKSQLDR